MKRKSWPFLTIIACLLLLALSSTPAEAGGRPSVSAQGGSAKTTSPGTQVAYEIRVENRGTTDDFNIQLRYDNPNGEWTVSASQEQIRINEDGAKTFFVYIKPHDNETRPDDGEVLQVTVEVEASSGFESDSTIVTTTCQEEYVEIKDDTPYDIQLWLHDDPDDVMNTLQEEPDADAQVLASMEWTYGLDDSGLLLPGDLEIFDGIGGEEKGVELQLTIENPNFFGGDIHVEFYLKDDKETIAEGSADIEANGEKTHWELEFTGPAAGLDSYLLEEGSALVLEMSADDHVDIIYDNGNDQYFLRFAGIQFYHLAVSLSREYQGEGSEGISPGHPDASRQAFHPNELEENARIYISGVVRNSLGNHDLKEIELEFYNAAEELLPDPGDGKAALIAVDDGEHYWMKFTYAWDYAEVPGLVDGEYDVKIILKDQLERGGYYKYGEPGFEMSAYGSFISLAKGESPEKQATPGGQVEFYHLVFNTGLEYDTFSLEAEGPDDWELRFKDGEKEISEVDVPAEASENEPPDTSVTLEVSIPADTKEGPYIVTAWARSSGDEGQYHDIQLLVNVSSQDNVRLYFKGDSGERNLFHEVMQSPRTANVSFYVLNNASDEDRFLLDWRNWTTGWDFQFIDSKTELPLFDGKIQLKGHEEREIWLRVETDHVVTAAENISQTIRARSENDTAQERYIHFSLTGIRPVAHIDSVTPDWVKEGQKVSFQGHATVYQQPGRYVWYSDLDGELHNDTLMEFETTELSSGWHTISLRVLADGFWSEAAWGEVTVNDRPRVYIDTYPPETILEWETLHLLGRGEDMNSIAAYAWRSSRDGDIYNGSETQWLEDGLSLGSHTIYFKVMDTKNVWSEEISFTLLVHKRPEAFLDSITPSKVREGEEILLSGSGEDDGSIVQYSWRSSLQGVLYNGSEDNFLTRDLGWGGHDIFFSVMDEHGIWSEEGQDQVYVNQRSLFGFTHPGEQDERADQSFTIVWEDEDRDDNAKIALYYSQEKELATAVQITAGLHEDNGTDSHIWEISALNEGEYYICAVVDDDFNEPLVIWSVSRVNITHESSNGETEDDDGNFLPGFTGTPTLVGFLLTGALVAFFRRKRTGTL